MTQQAPDTVKLTIDGREVEAPKGMLLVEAARLVDIDIPIFCYEPRLKPVGACRMCLVQIEKLPRLQTACTTPVAADMIVHTVTPEVKQAQTGVLELLLANHPLDCPICDKGGECPLQDNTFTYGPGASRFTEEKRHKEKALPLGPSIVLDRERCIMCYRCVRFHQEIPGDEALAAISRGAETEIATPEGEPYTSMFAGNTIELCPVGALTSRQYRFKARPWDLVRTPSVCNGCAVGCNVEVHSRIENVLRLVSRPNPTIDEGWLCDMGRFGTLPSMQRTRPQQPLVRDGQGNLRPATWEHAVERAVDLLGTKGGIVASAGLSNEAFGVLQRLLPRVPAALWPAPGEAWPVEGSIANLGRCKAIVLVGLDVWNELPILALWIRKAVMAGATLVVLGNVNGLERNTNYWLKGDPLELAKSLPSEVADALRGKSPAALLAHPSLVARGRRDLEALAQSIGADGFNGMLGAPLLGANGRGALERAPDVVRGNTDEVLASSAVCVIGDERWHETNTGSFARLIWASSQPLPEDPRIDVVLPMAHAYERQASITNLEGRVQQQEGGAAPIPHARADWSILTSLAERLGVLVGDAARSEAVAARA
jgi:NADH-quinone oxidoreductase subunit G